MKDESKYNYRMIITYDGTRYSGWQIQPNAESIQALIEEAIKTILRKEARVIGSGRTDAGVHALGQVAHFHHEQYIDLYKFIHSLNGLLPTDIRIKEVAPAPLQFHAQYSVISKMYHYFLCLGKVQNPMTRLYSYHYSHKLDCKLLVEAAQHFIGTHDFTSFANEAHAGSASRDAVRTLTRLDIIEEEEGMRLVFEADGFLYKMVRNIVGTLLEVAAGKRGIEEIPAILLAKDRKLAGQAAPPHGLFLHHVNYPEKLLKLDNV